MEFFKKVTYITFLALAGYWILAGAVFGTGQLMIHAATALVGAAYLTMRLFRGRGKLVWLAILVWPVLVVVCYQVISYWAVVINWTLDYAPVREHWNIVRLLDIMVMSVIVGLVAVVGRKIVANWRT